MSLFSQKFVPSDGLNKLIKDLRANGRVIVLTNGCFDILHIGHVRYLEQAKSLGDVLIVALNTDDTVRKLKGANRPINLEAERSEMIAALASVDYVTLFADNTPERIIEIIRPQYHVKGGDYRVEDMPEAPLVRSLGGEVVIVPLVPDRSTSGLIQRTRETRIAVTRGEET